MANMSAVHFETFLCPLCGKPKERSSESGAEWHVTFEDAEACFYGLVEG